MSLILSHARSGTAKTMFVFLLAVSALTATYLLYNSHFSTPSPRAQPTYQQVSSSENRWSET